MLLGVMLLLAACGDQNTPVAAGVAVTSVSSTAKGASQATTSKTTPKAGTTAPTETVHICTLLSRDEVAASLGGTVPQVDASRDALGAFGQGNCDYTTSTGGLTLQVSISSLTKADFEKNSIATNAQAVPDLGDSAFYQGGMLSTLKGKIVVVVFLLNPGVRQTGSLSSATDLTQKVLTALGKTSLASNLSATVAAVQGNTTEFPVYPGSVQIGDNAVSNIRTATFTSTDSFDTIVGWYKKLAADKSWAGSAAASPDTDYTIISAGKNGVDTSTRMVVSIEGPKKADRTAGPDKNGNPIVLGADSTLIMVVLTEN
jgi:hypothetical protein